MLAIQCNGQIVLRFKRSAKVTDEAYTAKIQKIKDLYYPTEDFTIADVPPRAASSEAYRLVVTLFSPEYDEKGYTFEVGKKYRSKETAEKDAKRIYGKISDSVSWEVVSP